ncbi:MAG: hypothetical protein LC667_20055 [Thioalkalivibrio sp.]|nr:hypothetical protein [Thioalkalivibrio sp.]
MKMNNPAMQPTLGTRTAEVQRQAPMMRNIPSLALLILGLVVMVVSFLYYAGNALPYPDPTAELLAHQAAEARKWSLLFALGLFASAIGGLCLWRRSRAKSCERGSSD